MNLATLVLRNALLRPEATAVSLGLSPFASHRTLAKRAASLAGEMRERFGVGPGDRVAMTMSNRPEFLEVLFAIWWAGGVAVPLNAKLHRDEFAHAVADSEARLVFSTPDLAETAASLQSEVPGLAVTIIAPSADYDRMAASDTALADPVRRAPEDLAWIFYTSGTTGRPKGAMLTHRNLTVMIYSHICDVAPVEASDIVLHAAPMSHGSGMVGLVHVAAGACNMVPETGGFDAAEIIEILRSRRGVGFFAAPTMINRLVRADGLDEQAAGGLGTIVYGGAPMYVEDLRRALDVLGPKLAQIYGQGEAPMTITALPAAIYAGADETILASAGFPRTGVEVKVADEAGRSLPPGSVGEVMVAGDIVMAGYWRNEAATAETVRDGWLATGDVGSFDDRGLLTLRDRSKDLIISGGSNVYPREIEEVLLTHPGVAEVSVIGEPDPEWGEAVAAVIVTAEGVTVDPADLDRLCLVRIARFKRPKRYRFVHSLPKNSYGKTLKRELRAMRLQFDD